MIQSGIKKIFPESKKIKLDQKTIIIACKLRANKKAPVFKLRLSV